ncbi:splicing factor, arginine/serine-rich 19 isoform X1 [Chelonia mydas]|uniref:splicing factor, arginine/serine-rich 19 isoform X1 n=2 Tax=Chelonia mydas TaxID=8469 RepID=UPI001CAA2807|nr:splicing factor, arginine/serine-rich 19 isoform X1 [Chelonia mydas]
MPGAVVPQFPSPPPGPADSISHRPPRRRSGRAGAGDGAERGPSLPAAMEEEENPPPLAPEDPVGGSEEQGRPSDSPPDREPCQPVPLCTGQVIMLKALQQVVSGSFQSERPGRASEKDAERKKMSRKKWCRSPRADGPGSGKGGTGDPMGTCDRSSTVPEALGLFSGLAGALQFLQRSCTASVQTRLLLGPPAICGDAEPDEVELVAEVRLGDVAAASGIFRRERAWRVHKSASLPGPLAPCWRGAGSLPAALAPPSGPLDLKWPHRTHGGAASLPGTGRTRRVPGRWAVALGTGTGVSNGQQRPQAPAGRDPEAQRSQPPPTSALEKADSSSSSSSSCSSSSSSSSSSQQAAPPGGGDSNPCPLRSPDLDIYDPFHPTDEDNPGGDFGYAASPGKQQDQKYDPFDPTGSNPSSSRSSPSPDEEEEEEEEEEEDDAAAAPRPDMSHSISRISETLAGIYDENSLSQDFPGSEKGREEAEPSEAPVAGGRRPEKELAAGADSTLPEEENASEQSDGAPEPPPEPRRRVFVVDLASKSRSEAEANPKLEGKVSLEVVTAGNPKAPARGEKGPKAGRHRGGRRPSLDWAGADSEIEEGEIVQPEDERYSPIRLFRSRCRPVEQRPLRVAEGDDFLSLHADSDEEGDFGESQPEPRWKAAADLRRKILTQRRERYRHDSPKHSGSSSGSRKKAKRSRERRPPKAKEPRAGPWPPKKKSKSRSKSKERRRSRSRRRGSRSRSRRRGSRSWSPSLSTSLSAMGSERRRRSRERRRGRRSRSGSRARHKEKHRDGGGGKKKKKQQRSRSREKRPPRDKEREVHVLEEPKAEERRRDARTVVPPSIQDLNDTDLFTIKRTITVSRQDGSPEPAKREVLYDSEGLSFEGCFSDREPAEGPRHSSSKGEGGLPRKERPEEEAKPPKEKERKRGYTEERPAPREKSKKRFKEAPGRSAPEVGKAEKEKSRPEREKPPRKAKAGHKDSGKAGGSGRKVKLQSKVAVLIREGVSSTTVSGKEGGSIGIKFSRDKESRSPFLKPEEKGPGADAKAEPAKEPGVKAKKVKGLKAKAGLKKAKGPGAKTKGPSEAKKKKKLKAKTGLKKSKADSCSQGAGSPPAPAPEPAEGACSPRSPPPKPPPAPAEQELTPDSQTVDSSCKTPDVSFLPEEVAAPVPGEQQRAPAGEAQADSLSEPKEEPARVPPPPPAPTAWNLQGGVDCTTSSVLALTALLFKMEEANLASRAKAHELIQATNQILSHTKPSTSLAGSQVPAPPPTHTAAPYLLHGSLPLVGCSSTPPTPTGLPGTLGPASSGPGSGTLFGTGSGSDLGKRDGSTSSDGRGDTDKYLKKLHTQERAVEEVKLAIKPYYQKKEITKEEYKDILRKAVHKICHSKSGEINPVKVNNLVRAYVQRYKYFRKHGRRMEEEPGGPKDLGALEKASLPMPPL